MVKKSHVCFTFFNQFHYFNFKNSKDVVLEFDTCTQSVVIKLAWVKSYIFKHFLFALDIEKFLKIFNIMKMYHFC